MYLFYFSNDFSISKSILFFAATIIYCCMLTVEKGIVRDFNFSTWMSLHKNEKVEEKKLIMKTYVNNFHQKILVLSQVTHE